MSADTLLCGQLIDMHDPKYRISAKEWAALPENKPGSIVPTGFSKAMEPNGRALLIYVPASCAYRAIVLRPIIAVPCGRAAE